MRRRRPLIDFPPYQNGYGSEGILATFGRLTSYALVIALIIKIALIIWG